MIVPVNIFASKEYALLLWLSEHQINIRNKRVIRYSQNEIADEIQCSPVTVNKWIKALCTSGCLVQTKKGNYYITPNGNEVIAAMTKIDLIVGGTRHGK